MQKRKAWFFVLVALAVAAMFILPGIATGKQGDNNGGGGQPKPCPTNKTRPNEPPPNCKPGDTTGDPTTGDPTTGDPTTGDPTTGDPTTGDPTTGVANECSDDISIVDENGPVKIHLEPSDDTHGTGVVPLVHACVTLGQPPAPEPEAPCPATDGDAVIIPDVLELRTNGASYITACAHI